MSADQKVNAPAAKPFAIPEFVRSALGIQRLPTAAEALAAPHPTYTGPTFTPEAVEALWKLLPRGVVVDIRWVKGFDRKKPLCGDAVRLETFVDSDFAVAQAGAFADGQMAGRGAKVHRDGTVFRGEMLGKRLGGVGVKHNAQQICAGNFMLDWMFGDGVRRSSTMVCSGSFQTDWLNGPGMILTASRRVEGVFHNEHDGMRMGHGVIRATDGSVYRGNFDASFAECTKEGTGTEYCARTRTKFVGPFKADKRHGEGIETDTVTRLRYAVTYAEGKRVGGYEKRGVGSALVLACPGEGESDLRSAKRHAVDGRSGEAASAEDRAERGKAVGLPGVSKDMGLLHETLRGRGFSISAGSVYDAKLTRESVLSRVTEFFNEQKSPAHMTEFVLAFAGHGAAPARRSARDCSADRRAFRPARGVWPTANTWRSTTSGHCGRNRRRSKGPARI